MIGEELFEAFLIGAELEVVVPFVGPHQRLAGDRTEEVALLGLRLGDVFLLPFVVPTFEFAEVDVAGLEQTLDE